MFKKLLSFLTSKKNTTQQTVEVAHLPSMSPDGTQEILIKGNINGKGDKIYHIPEGRFYSITKSSINFYSEEEAQIAGFRKSKM